MSKTQRLAAALQRFGGGRALDMYWGSKRLTVLNYHRVLDADAPDFPYYRTNISCSPQMFARQMDYLAEHFTVVDLAAVRAFVTEGKPLPPRPALITFDDGYLDNYQNALPVLKQHSFPAVIFLTTSRMEDGRPLWWDECAYYFAHTTQTQATLPLIGEADLATPQALGAARESLLRTMKTVPEAQKLQALQETGAALGVAPPPPDPDLFLNWDQVRELVANGVACQPHTVTHPILTRIPPEQVQAEIADSSARIAAETGQDIMGFAYPNGTATDYDATALQALRDVGIPLAFTLLPGPARPKAVRDKPLEIARIYFGHRDTFEIFVMKLLGLPAVMSFLPGF